MALAYSAPGTSISTDTANSGLTYIIGNTSIFITSIAANPWRFRSRSVLRGHLTKNTFIRDQTSPADSFRPMPVKDRISLPASRRKTGRGR